MISREEEEQLKGKWVAVILDWSDPAGIVHGQLLGISDDGEVALTMPGRSTYYSWPALQVVGVERD